MKMKQYLRGIATGIVIAVAVMSFFQRGNSGAVTDEEIRERAAALGMVMAGSGTLSGSHKADSGGTIESSYQGTIPDKMDGTKSEPVGTGDGESQAGEESSFTETEEDPGESQGQEASGEPEGSQPSGESEEGNQSLKESEEGNQPSEGTEEEDQPSEGTEEDDQPPEDADAVTVTISPGSGSGTVARLLQEAGLVEDAEEFDRFLCDGGYENSIHTGVFRIPAGSGYETIARIITTAP